MKRALIRSLGLAILTAAFCGGAMAVSLPAGTEIQVRLNYPLSTETARAGQAFSGVLMQAVTVNGRQVLARGATVRGLVKNVVSSGRLKRPASITLELVEADGQSVQAEPLRIDGKSHLVRNTEIIGGESGAGALLGALLGGKRGALIGAAAGAGAGTVTAYMTGKKEIVLPAETRLSFVAGGSASQQAGSYSSPRYPSNQRQPAYSNQGQPESGGRRQAYGGDNAQGNEQSPRYAKRESRPEFTTSDRETIRRYFEDQSSNLPHGLAKRGGHLPPGLERHIERDGTLPPGLQKRVQPFPEHLTRELPPLPSGCGCQRVILGDRALIIDAASRILDVFLYR